MTPRKPTTTSPRARIQRALDSWFPTLLRYAGLGLMVYAALVDQGRNPALIPAAGGMIAFKALYTAGDGRRD